MGWSLRYAAGVIDRYATRDTTIGNTGVDDVAVAAGDLITVSLLGANRDPAVFEQPDRFDLDRPNKHQHVSFVQGPHGCLGLHLTRMETIAAINALLDLAPDVGLDQAASSPPAGLIFRKPDAVVVNLA